MTTHRNIPHQHVQLYLDSLYHMIATSIGGVVRGEQRVGGSIPGLVWNDVWNERDKTRTYCLPGPVACAHTHRYIIEIVMVLISAVLTVYSSNF